MEDDGWHVLAVNLNRCLALVRGPDGSEEVVGLAVVVDGVSAVAGPLGNGSWLSFSLGGFEAEVLH